MEATQETETTVESSADVQQLATNTWFFSRIPYKIDAVDTNITQVLELCGWVESDRLYVSDRQMYETVSLNQGQLDGVVHTYGETYGTVATDSISRTLERDGIDDDDIPARLGGTDSLLSYGDLAHLADEQLVYVYDYESETVVACRPTYELECTLHATANTDPHTIRHRVADRDAAEQLRSDIQDAIDEHGYVWCERNGDYNIDLRSSMSDYMEKVITEDRHAINGLFAANIAACLLGLLTPIPFYYAQTAFFTLAMGFVLLWISYSVYMSVTSEVSSSEAVLENSDTRTAQIDSIMDETTNVASWTTLQVVERSNNTVRVVDPEVDAEWTLQHPSEIHELNGYLTDIVFSKKGDRVVAPVGSAENALQSPRTRESDCGEWLLYDQHPELPSVTIGSAD